MTTYGETSHMGQEYRNSMRIKNVEIGADFWPYPHNQRGQWPIGGYHWIPHAQYVCIITSRNGILIVVYSHSEIAEIGADFR